MADEQPEPETPETPGEAFDSLLVEAPLAELEKFVAEAPQLLSSKPLKSLEFLLDLKARVDARLAAEPEERVSSTSGSHEIRVRFWYEIADMLKAEINWRSNHVIQSSSALRGKKSLGPGAQKEHSVAARRTIVSQNPGVRAQELCQILDRENIALPKGWPEAGFSTWQGAWRERQRRIDVIFSKDRRAG